METIVVGYEGSEAAERALARAADIAEAFSARLVVVSTASTAAPAVALEPAAVLVPPAAAGPLATGGTAPIPEYQVEPPLPDPEEVARRELERARMSIAGRRVEAEYVVEVGDPVERLLEVAHQQDADLIVVGHHERSFLERLLGRGVDEAVARRSDRDVLLVH